LIFCIKDYEFGASIFSGVNLIKAQLRLLPQHQVLIQVLFFMTLTWLWPGFFVMRITG